MIDVFADTGKRLPCLRITTGFQGNSLIAAIRQDCEFSGERDEP